MLGLFAVLSAASLIPTKDTKVAVCDVGRVALRDLPVIDGNANYARFYGDAHLRSGNLLTACPDLRRELPPGFPAANDAARTRANIHAPIRGQTIPLTIIFTIGVPVISADGKSATVEMGYTCTGLCGAGFTARYVLASDGWRRDGAITNNFVS